MSALAVCGWIFAGVCVGTWLLSVLTREYSWVDRIWSLVPVAYLAVFAGSRRLPRRPAGPDARRWSRSGAPG